jgi:hypothetical protein
MAIQIELTPAVVTSGLTLIGAALTGGFFLGDSRWRKRAEDEKLHGDLEADIAENRKVCDDRHLETSGKLVAHQTRLDAGDIAISELKGMLQAHGNTLGQIQSGIAGIEGQLKARHP